MEAFGWRNAVYAHGDDSSTSSAAGSGLLPRSDILALGVATSTFLLIVVCQLVVQWLLTTIKWPIVGNLEDPTESFRYSPATHDLLHVYYPVLVVQSSSLTMTWTLYMGRPRRQGSARAEAASAFVCKAQQP